MPRHQPEAHLGHGLGRDHGLGALAGKPAPDAVNLEGGKGPDPLQHGELLEPDQGPPGHLFLEKLLLIEGEALPVLALRLGGRLDRLVELGDIDPPGASLQVGEQTNQGFHRVGRRAAVAARMQIPLQGPHLNLGIAHAAKAGVDGRQSGSIVAHVGHHDRVHGGPLGLAAEQIEDHPAAALLFALDDEVHIEGRLAVGIQRRLIGLEQREDLALVVHGPPGIQLSVPHGGLEWRGDPLVDRIDRLDIVVAVAEHRRLALDPGALGPDHRMSGALEQFDHRKAQSAEFVHEPGRRTAAIRRVGGERADARNGEEFVELSEEFVVIHCAESGVRGQGSRIRGF